jgi:hypothetical protein
MLHFMSVLILLGPLPHSTEQCQLCALDSGLLAALTELIQSSKHTETLQEACRALLNITSYNIVCNDAARSANVPAALTRLRDAEFTQNSVRLQSMLAKLVAQILLTDLTYRNDMATLSNAILHN